MMPRCATEGLLWNTPWMVWEASQLLLPGLCFWNHRLVVRNAEPWFDVQWIALFLELPKLLEMPLNYDLCIVPIWKSHASRFLAKPNIQKKTSPTKEKQTTSQCRTKETTKKTTFTSYKKRLSKLQPRPGLQRVQTAVGLLVKTDQTGPRPFGGEKFEKHHPIERQYFFQRAFGSPGCSFYMTPPSPSLAKLAKAESRSLGLG